MDKNASSIAEDLSPLERNVLLNFHHDLEIISKKTELDKSAVGKAMRMLESKNIVKSVNKESIFVELGVNGIYYKKHHLPERNLIICLENSSHFSIEEAQKKSKLSENEFKVSLGILKNKGLISLVNGKIQLIGNKESIIQKMKEEHLLEILPSEINKIPDDLKQTLEQLRKRKDIVEFKPQVSSTFTLTELGEKIDKNSLNSDMLEEVTPEMIIEGVKGKKFRRYDLSLPVQRLPAGRKHFVNQALEYGRRIWTDLGFKEMSGNISDTSFWVFDSLYTPQNHAAREMQDTFFIKEASGVLPNPELVKKVAKAHESGVQGNKGWNYAWSPEVSKKVVLRTHTTSLSARTLANLKLSDLPAKYFAIGKVFRNETVDWNHGFEFYQTEGIVVDENANLRHLLGYLKEFYKKNGI